MVRKLTLLALAGCFAAPAMAQEAREQDSDPIIVEGQQLDDRVRPSDGHITAFWLAVRDERLSTSGAKTGGNMVQGNPQNFDPSSQPREYQREVRKASLYGRAIVNWETTKATHELDSKSPLVLYGVAGRMAYCALLSAQDGVRDYIDTSAEPDYEALTKAFRYKHMQCSDSAERASPAEMVNAALAEMMVMGAVAQPPLRANVIDQAAAASFLSAGGSQTGLDAIGRCAAIFSPGFAFDVLYTKPGSDEEAAMLDLLYANSPECGLKERPKKISTVYQRMALAMGLYRWYGLSGEEWGEAS